MRDTRMVANIRLWGPVLRRLVKTGVFLIVCGICPAGCGDKFLDPTQIGRFRPVPAVNVILDSLGVAEEAPSTWEGAEEPKPIDIIAYETDYIFGPGDIVRISIFELLQEGATLTDNYIVTESGRISIPEIGTVEAAGLTESQLEEEIKQILSPNILKEPSVTVTLMSSQQRTFSILGIGVPNPGRYSIPRYDFRLLDALAIAGGIGQFNISYIYISRPVTGKEAMVEPAITVPQEPEKLIEPEQEMLEIIAPRAQGPGTALSQGLVITTAEMITDRELAEAALPAGFEPPAGQEEQQKLEASPEPAGRETIAEPLEQQQQGRIEWIFQDGKWVPVRVGGPQVTEPAAEVEPKKAAEPLREKVPEQFEWGQIGAGQVQARVIKIPADKLTGGDPRYNVVIRPGDTVQVPVDIIGEFCIMGNVNAQGFIFLTGRPMTLKMAVAAAGGLGPLAWPKSCEVTRRIGKKKEETVMVDLDKIASGEQPDFFIKPNDLINVGTHLTARWRAVLRNAFRATYGFGFIYDRNFADRDYGTSRPIPHWF
jgi:polysaccharide export outer membrane protein